MNISLLIAGLIFLFITLLGLITLSRAEIYRKRKDIKERIRQETEPEDDETALKKRSWKAVIIEAVRKLGESVRPKNEADISRVRKRLLRAGYHGESGPLLFFGSKLLGALIGFVIFLIITILVVKTLPAQQFLALMAAVSAIGFYLPDLQVYQRTEKRKKQMFEGFPDALDLMVVCVEAGMGLDAAIKRVGDEMAIRNKVLSEEFRIVSLELRAGKTRADALRNLAMRNDIEDISSFVTLLIQTDRFGTRVAQSLRVHSDAMRTKRYQRAEEIAAKLPVKIVLPLVFFIFPALFVAIIGPAGISIYRNFITNQ